MSFSRRSYFLLTAFFPTALLLTALLTAACSYKEPGAFPFITESETAKPTEPTPVLYGLSRNSSAGVLGPEDGRPLEYVFDKPLDLPAGSFLEISYTLSKSAGEWPGIFVLELGSLAWELPRDLSFLGIDELPSLIRYAVPTAGSGRLGGIGIRREDSGGPSGAQAPELAILRMKLTEEGWYGFSLEDDSSGGAGAFSASLTPFVYYRAEGGRIVLDPPRQFLRAGTSALKAEAYSGGISVEAGGGGGFLIETRPESTEIDLPQGWPASFPLSLGGGPFRRVMLLPAALPGEEPVAADPGLVLSWPAESWKETGYAVFRWDAFPQVLIFDTADYAVQDRLFKRLAFFVEKRGFRGRLAPDEEIAGLHGWNAHDYRSRDLAAFFAAAEEADFPLNTGELEIRALLLDSGVLARRNGKIVPGAGAVISISRESDAYLRRLFMAHEGFHGIYFIDEDFRDFSRRRWEGLSEPVRRFVLAYFDFQAYDISDQDLVINEFMAHVLQQDESQAGAYFGGILPNRMVARSPRRESALPDEGRPDSGGTRYWAVLDRAFRAEAEAFSRYVRQRWGLAAGRVWRLSVSRSPDF